VVAVRSLIAPGPVEATAHSPSLEAAAGRPLFPGRRRSCGETEFLWSGESRSKGDPLLLAAVGGVPGGWVWRRGESSDRAGGAVKRVQSGVRYGLREFAAPRAAPQETVGCLELRDDWGGGARYPACYSDSSVEKSNKADARDRAFVLSTRFVAGCFKAPFAAFSCSAASFCLRLNFAKSMGSGTSLPSCLAVSIHS
jgi:hypothetical protein